MGLWVAVVPSLLRQRVRKMDRQVARLTYTLILGPYVDHESRWVTPVNILKQLAASRLMV